ncbi:MAG: bZIP transcription factor [Armatimonadetes bacterium]|nr:bZIP transcription factor [Armatimonadota bacterium]
MKCKPLALTATLFLVGSPAVLAQQKRPDSLQSLGVGARSTGVGGAFVALSEDLTALFWNPAGLSHLTRAQLALDFRTLPRTIFADQSVAGPRELGATGLNFSFAGFAYPLARELGPGELNRKGTLAFSRALVGYEQTLALGPGAVPSIARYWFTSAGYGKQVSPLLRVGLGVHYVQLNTLSPDDPLGGSPSAQGAGNGVTFSVGTKWKPKPDSPTTVGFNYLHPTRVSSLGLAGAVFGERISGRVSTGLAYDYGEIGPGNLTFSLEGRYYFGGNSGGDALEQRGNVADVHVGAEYAIPRGDRTYFLRGGFYTRNASDPVLFFDDRVLTFGVGVEQNQKVRLDVGVEVSTIDGSPTVTSSLRYFLPAGRPGTPPVDRVTQPRRKSQEERIKELEQKVQELEMLLQELRKPKEQP